MPLESNLGLAGLGDMDYLVPVKPSLSLVSTLVFGVLLPVFWGAACGNASSGNGEVDAALGDGRSTQEVLGVHYSPEKTTFGIWSPDHKKVELLLDGSLYPLNALPDTLLYQDVYEVEVLGDHALKKYHFIVADKVVRDPYARMVEPNTNSAIVMDLSRTALPQWAELPPLPNREDAIIYEVHVRDFSISSSSGIQADKRGKFLGMVQAGTRFTEADEIATGID
ncbi:MAG: hypothetical protein JKY56_09450, partial [Kofleriaceae bacterium]|nr:hypothetical protein [Kofleriaceae bacterium]